MPDLPLRCQVGDCGNRAALTVTVELPIDWSESRTYNVVTLQVAVCGDCAAQLESLGHGLLEARVRFARRLETIAHYAELMRAHLALIEAVGAPFEPVQGTTFATWIAKLDRPRAQSAWRLLAFVKRQTLEGMTVRDGWWRKARPPRASTESGRRASDRPLSIEDARFRRRVLERPPEPPPRTPPPLRFPPPDDAA